MSFSRSRTGLALAGALLTVGATTALAEGEFVPALTAGQVYLQCSEPSKEYVVGTFVNDDAGVPTWSEPAPASVTTGAGCGKLDEPLFSGTSQETPYTFAFKGKVKGNIDEITITLHTADLGAGRVPGATETLAVRASVGGKSLFGTTELTSVAGDVVFSPKERLVEVTPVATGSTGQVRALTFTITNIDFLAEADLARASGHEIIIDVRDGTPNGVRGTSNAHAWLWGAAEAPSGVVFTPETPSTSLMTADERSTRK